MTFAQMKLDVFRRTGYQDTPATAVSTRIGGFINEAQQELLAEKMLAPLLRSEITFTTTASTPTYGLPPTVTRILTVRDTAHRRRLISQTNDWWRFVAPDPTTVTGTPQYYIPLGTRPVASQPSAADKVYAVSTNAGDTTQTLYYEVVRTGGYMQQGSITLNGLTAVQLDTLTDIVAINDWYLSAAAAGQVSLLQTSNVGPTLATLTIGGTHPRYQWIGLYPTPSAVYTYTLEHELDATDLVQDTDEPVWLPPRMHRLLAVGARKREYEQKADVPRQMAAQAEWDKGVLALKSYVNNPPDQTVVPGRLHPGLSDLGAFFPAGTVWD